MTVGVRATEAALEVIDRLKSGHGPLAFFQSGGCCDGSSAICLKRGDLPQSRYDVQLGEIGGAPFYIDGDQHERWGRPSFVIDVVLGAPEGFSLEGLEGVHFVSGHTVTRPKGYSRSMIGGSGRVFVARWGWALAEGVVSAGGDSSIPSTATTAPATSVHARRQQAEAFEARRAPDVERIHRTWLYGHSGRSRLR